MRRQTWPCIIYRIAYFSTIALVAVVLVLFLPKIAWSNIDNNEGFCFELSEICKSYNKGNETEFLAFSNDIYNSANHVKSLVQSADDQLYVFDSLCIAEAVILHGMSYSGVGVFKDTLSARDGTDSLTITVEILKEYDCTVDQNCNLESNDDDLDVIITIEELSCTGNITLTSNIENANFYHWFKDSMLLAADVIGFLVIDHNLPDKEGTYQLVVETDSSCVVSNEVVIDLPDQLYLDTLYLCADEVYQFGDTLIETTGTYNHTFDASIIDCDSSVQLRVFQDSTLRVVTSIELCEGQSYLWFNRLIDSAGIYSDTIFRSPGCDSLLELFITHKSQPRKSVAPVICEGEFYSLLNDTFYISGLYEQIIPSLTEDCDTLIMIDLEVRESPKGDTTYFNLLGGQTLDFRGEQYSDGGIFTYHIPSQEMCDSLNYLSINIIEEIPSGSFYMPNIFSPNHDGINDEFSVYLEDQSTTSITDIKVLDRWGSQLWEYNSSSSNSWDGYFNGKVAENGVYIVIIALQSIDGKSQMHIKDLTLIR